MSMKTTSMAVSIVLALGLAAPVFGQQAIKVGVVNSQRAFESSAEGKKAAGQLQERDNRIKSDLARMDNELKQLQTKLSAQRLTMSADALLQLQADIDKKTTAQKRYQEDATRDIQKLQYDIVQRVRGDMVSVVETIAKEKGLDLVLDLGSSGVVYFNKTIEITDDVIKRYDEAKTAPVKK
jgi:outer membrane protein